jgi:PAS domain S-box-containing protein
MSTVTSLPWPKVSARESSEFTFRFFFENAPIAVARCDREGVIVDSNPAFERKFGHAIFNHILPQFCELVLLPKRTDADSLLSDLFHSQRNGVGFSIAGVDRDCNPVKLTLWRQSDSSVEPEYALIIAEDVSAGEIVPAEIVPIEIVPIATGAQESIAESTPAKGSLVPLESTMQTRRWEAIGRLTGGVVHDFNNLLTGVMLYSDLLLSSLDTRDLRRCYANEIRSAIVQASGLVRQLLVFVRPQQTSISAVSLNEIAEGVQDLLARLVGENITLELRLDPQLSPVQIACSQAQQVLINLVLNARDALPQGGRIAVETSNCRFMPVAGAVSADAASAFPCVLLAVSDNGEGMTAETRRRLFEPFFTTKSAKGSGLGLTTVHSIVTANRGLVHFESQPGSGTRALILLPQATQSGMDRSTGRRADSLPPVPPLLHDAKEESLL